MGICRSCPMPSTISKTAPAITRKRYWRLAPRIARIVPFAPALTEGRSAKAGEGGAAQSCQRRARLPWGGDHPLAGGTSAGGRGPTQGNPPSPGRIMRKHARPHKTALDHTAHKVWTAGTTGAGPSVRGALTSCGLLEPVSPVLVGRRLELSGGSSRGREL